VNEKISLNGIWKFKPDPDNVGDSFRYELLRAAKIDSEYMKVSYNDDHWDDIKVPAHWQAEGYDYNGAAWYRTSFKIVKDKQLRLRFKGVDYYAEVWLNGYFLGCNEGYFNPFEFDITPFVKEDDNILAVKVNSPNPPFTLKIKERRHYNYLIKGAIQNWDANNLNLNPGGIWNDVDLLVSDQVYIQQLKVVSQVDAIKGDQADAKITLQLMLRNEDEMECAGDILVTVRPANFEGDGQKFKERVYIPSGSSQKELRFTMNNALLWWPWDQGNPNLYEAEVKLLGPGYSDYSSVRFGLRTVERKKGWAIYINQRRVFLRGTCYLSDQMMSLTNEARYREDLQLVKEANLNAIRVYANIEKQYFYNLCDEMGFLLMQDYPFQWEYDLNVTFIKKAELMLRQMLTMLSNHPSIVIWSIHSEADHNCFRKLDTAVYNLGLSLDKTRVWHKTNKIIGNRKSSPVDWEREFPWDVEHETFTGIYDYIGWYEGKTESLPDFNRERFQLICEFGVQALPDQKLLEEIIPKADLWPPKWPTWSKKNFQKEEQFLWINTPASLEEFIASSQNYQTEFLKKHIAFYRLFKFKPCNGYFQFILTDCWPAITWSVCDYRRQPKKGYYALQAVSQPLLPIINPYPVQCEDGLKEYEIWVINDFNRDFTDVILSIEILNNGKQEIFDQTTIQVRKNENCIIKKIQLSDDGKYEYNLKIIQENKIISQYSDILGFWAKGSGVNEFRTGSSK
jgi:beta-mannosidase